MTERTDNLSERELEILRLVATGAPNKEIARLLLISPNTVKVHLRNIFGKIGVTTRTEATLYAVQIGLVMPGAAAAAEEEQAQPVEEGPVSLAPPEAITAGAIMDEASSTAIPAPDSLSIPPVPALRRRWALWQISLMAVVVVLLLVGSGIAGARLAAAPTFFPTAALRAAATQTVPVSRWGKRPALPAPRKGMGMVEYGTALYLLGGETASGPDTAVLRYDLQKNKWETMAPKPTGVTEVQAALLGEKIYVPGGLTASGEPTPKLEVYDPRGNAWEQKASLPVPVSAYALAPFEGRLYLFGGKNNGGYLSTVYIYLPEEDRWIEGTPLQVARAYAGAAVLGSRIHILGGYDGQHALAVHQAYIPSRDSAGEVPWENYAPLAGGRYAMGVTHLGNTIYVGGGLSEGGKPAHPVSMQFILQANAWSAMETPPISAGTLPGLLASGDYLYLMGGETAGKLLTENQAYQAIYTISVPMLQSGENE